VNAKWLNVLHIDWGHILHIADISKWNGDIALDTMRRTSTMFLQKVTSNPDFCYHYL
jgi:hypothetical protein